MTENAANMVKAFNFCIPGFEKQSQTAASAENSDGADPMNGLSEMSDEYSQESDSNEAFELLPNHSSCLAHTLQFVFWDGIADCGNHLRQLIAKANSNVNHVRKTINAYDILEDEKRLQTAKALDSIPNIYMLESILRVEEDTNI